MKNHKTNFSGYLLTEIGFIFILGSLLPSVIPSLNQYFLAELIAAQLNFFGAGLLVSAIFLFIYRHLWENIDFLKNLDKKLSAPQVLQKTR